MADKADGGKDKGRASNSDLVSSVEPEATPLDSPSGVSGVADGAGDKGLGSPPADGTAAADMEESENPSQEAPRKQTEGELLLYPVSVKTQSGEKIELQLSPGDSVIDIRQFLLDAPETCFFTCYDLILRTKDGSVHHMEDYNEISEVADITAGGCSIEMVAALYDDRSIRSHVRRARELLSPSSVQSSLSTLLALQHESTQQKPSEMVKAESAEIDGLGFMEDITGTLPKLMTSSPKEIKCVESIMFSTLNPPPSYRRLVGDLIYTDLVTLEGNKFCITGTTKGFYVNSSTGNILDPRPSKPAYEASTLIGLLQKISTKFKKGFREILDQKASAHPFENVQALLSPNSWLGAYPVPDHKSDAARSEESLVLSYGSELVGMQRDWNEELQACRELPHTTPQERILRGRALYKVTSEFVDAATKGAMGVINRCIPPINPPDPECFYMYVHNNIFFSFAVDADLGHISHDTDSSPQLIQLGTKNSEVTISSNSLAKSSNVTSSEATGSSDSCIPSSSDTEQLKTLRDPTSVESAEAQTPDGEQATYASANNDLKGTKAYQEADVPGLYNLAMAIIDYRGYRVVAQSIIPGILQGDKSDSLLYGSVDNGKKICWNESFHSKVVEAAKRLHLKEHAVLDGSGNVVSLAAPVECKGIVGTDDRHYLLDLMRLTPRDANYMGPGHRFCVLRPELVASFCKAEAAESSELAAESDGHAPEGPNIQSSTTADVKNSSVEVPDKAGEKSVSSRARHRILPEEILLNPNVLTEFKLAGSEEEIAADEAIVRKAASYLMDVVVPKFVQDLCSLEISPMDGQTLTEALHAHGINIRYLGKVAEMVKHLPHLWDICSVEIIVRSTKHIMKDVLRETHDHDLGPAVAHFCNCFFGRVPDIGTKGSTNSMQSKTSRKFSQAQENNHNLHKSVKGQSRKSHGASSGKSHAARPLLTSNELWSYIQEFARFKFQFELPENARLLVKKIAVIRNLCQKVGIAIAARKYNLEASEPFQTSDILDLQPVVKHSIPLCSEARDLMETGKARLAEGMLSEAHALFSEAFSLLQQITGPMHRDVASCCRYLAMVLYHAGDMAGAIVHQHKELIINERCLGLDHPDTAHSYGNMALFYHGLNQTELALRHMSRTLLLLSLSSGPEHPDVAATFINVAMMYQDAGNMNATLRYLQEALKKNERLLGPEHIQTAVCYHALAIAFSSMGTYKLSIQHEKKTHDILAKQLGEEDSRTRDSENWLKKFKLLSQQVDAQKQKGNALNSAEALKAINILKARPDLLQAFQAAAVGSGVAGGSAASKSLSAALIGEALPRGRGVDERAARAAAEVRKKAAAKGLQVRQNGVPLQPISQLSQILNMISSGTTASDGITNVQSDEPKVEASNGAIPNGSSVTVKDTNGSLLQDQAPVGLGTTLTSLDSKKQKSRHKVAAS